VRERLEDCDTILLLGAGGSTFWNRMTEALGTGFAAEPRPDYHPINEYSARLANETCGLLLSAGYRCQVVYPDDHPPLNFLQLAEMAGLGTISPVIGLLLNPDFGPWVSLRAAVLVAGNPFGLDERNRSEPFQPCLTCHKPCLVPCPVGVFDGRGNADFRACGKHRHGGGCTNGCDVRRACPVGEEHRYGAEEERFRHAYSYYTLRRAYGFGWRKLLPRAWR
jgi:epoxyqueuosine reductase QueG